MRCAKVCGMVLFLSCFVFAGQHAPLPPALMSAKTLYIENNTGHADVADRCFDELSKWGRFKIVSSPSDADLVFQVGTNSRTYGYSGHSSADGSGNVDTSLTDDRVSFTTISVIDKTGQVLWSDTRRWGNLFNGFHSATREVVKELRRRVEEQESKPN
jgi:hypothetical protein